jgi:hypothetical protein
MTWVPLLLADPSPCLRLMVLRDLLGKPEDDPEVRELVALRQEDPLVADLLALQKPDGSWDSRDLRWLTRTPQTWTTTLALARLGYLGFGANHPAVRRGAEHLFGEQCEDGSWPLPRIQEHSEADSGYSMVPLQTAVPLHSLAMCGYATDPRAEQAYTWLLARQLPDGAWPTGIASGNYGYVAGYRRLAHSRWGCRSNTTAALNALVHHPKYGNGPAARQALDLVLGRETRETQSLGFEVARLLGAEPVRGFFTYHARFDLAVVLDLCWRVGATGDDARVADLVEWIYQAQGPYGLWEYGPRPQVSRWVTFDLLRSLYQLERNGGSEQAWLSQEPRTPFHAYRPRPRRF